MYYREPVAETSIRGVSAWGRKKMVKKANMMTVQAERKKMKESLPLNMSSLCPQLPKLVKCIM